MKKLMKGFVVFAVLIGTIMSSQPVFASENKDDDYGIKEELKVVTIYADLSNEEEVISKVDLEFKLHEDEIVVEVRDYSELTNKSLLKSLIGTRAVPDPFWQNTNRLFFVGSTAYYTIGYIKGWVQGSRVSSVSGSVTNGNGVTYVSRSYHNTTTTGACMKWTVKRGNKEYNFTVNLFY